MPVWKKRRIWGKRWIQLVSAGHYDRKLHIIRDPFRVAGEGARLRIPFHFGERLNEKYHGETMVKLLVREKESIQEAVRRFRKLVERSGIKKEMRRREFYEKPSETKRRARLRAERRSKRNRMLAARR